MLAFDLHVHSAFSEGESTLEQLVQMAKRLGYSGICFAEYYENEGQLKKLKEDVAKVGAKIGIEVFLGFEARTVKELDTLRRKRKFFDVLLARGGELEMNRAACEASEVDILTHPELNRNDSGLNHIMARLAAKNNVAIEINFREILMASERTRSKILANMRNNVKLAKKYGAPVILCSGSISHWEMRDPLCMSSMTMQLGLAIEEAKNAVSKVPAEIVKRAKTRTGGKWVMPGVEVKSGTKKTNG